MTFNRLPATATVEDLTSQQAAFVRSYMELGGRQGCAAAAALAAGYGDGVQEKAARRARELLKNTRILSAIKTELKETFGAATVLALNTLMELCEEGPPSVRLSAAKELLDRGYGPVPSRTAAAEFDERARIIMMLDARIEAEEIREERK